VYYVEITLLIAGFVLLLIGYRKNSRNILVGSAIVLLLAGAFPDLVAGFQDGARYPFPT
jgi:hypothetical protein